MVLLNQLIYLVTVKTMKMIFSNYVCFSKSPNFIKCFEILIRNLLLDPDIFVTAMADAVKELNLRGYSLLPFCPQNLGKIALREFRTIKIWLTILPSDLVKKKCIYKSTNFAHCFEFCTSWTTLPVINLSRKKWEHSITFSIFNDAIKFRFFW